MESVLSFFRDLSVKNNELFQSLTTEGEPDSQKLRTYLIKNKIECKGSNMFFLVQALSDSLLLATNVTTTPTTKQDSLVTTLDVKPEVENLKEEIVSTLKDETKRMIFSRKDFDPASVQSLSFEFEVLHGVYKIGRPDDSRQKALEDAHIKCDQALDWIVEIKNTTEDFASVIGGITYAADTPSLANSLFELYLQLN
jgi:hypothetical protein